MESPAARFLGGMSEHTGLREVLNVTTHSKSDAHIQALSGLPLFDWRAAIVRKPSTRAGRFLQSRFPVPPGHADLIADLAGLGGRAD